MPSWLKNKTIAAVFLLFIVTGIVASQQVKQPSSVSTAQSYLIRGGSIDAMTALVAKEGGHVSHELPIINAVGAVLSEEQVAKLRQHSGLTVVTDRQLRTHSSNDEDSTDEQSETDVENDAEEYQAEQVEQRRAIDTYIAEQTGAKALHDMGITGQGVTVAVVDSGISFGGKAGRFLRFDKDGKKRVLAAYNAINDRLNNRRNMDQNGHGSHVAGVAVSSVKADGKYNGVAPDANLVSVKAFDKYGNGTYLDVIRGLDWVLANASEYGIRVVNLSFGASAQSYYWNDPLNQAAMKLWEAGIVVVTSAGNAGEDMSITVPGNLPYVITVGATTDSFTPFDYSDDAMASFSSAGPTVEGFVKPEVVAWGGHVLSKINAAKANQIEKWYPANDIGKDYFEISGTSQASAVVTGIVALMLQSEPFLTPDDVKCRLVDSARPAQSPKGMWAYSPFKQGAGLSNAWDAVHSTAASCANQGLDIAADLAGIEHYQGPTRVDEKGSLYLVGKDGEIWTNGSRWNDLNTQGSRWNDISTQGSRWNDISTQGSRWNDQNVWSQGSRWNDLTIQGSRWNDISTQGSRWNDLSIQTMSVNDWVRAE